MIGSKEFLLTVIFILVAFICFEMVLVHGYEGLTDRLLSTVDDLLKIIGSRMDEG